MSSEGTEASPPQADPEEARAETEARRRVVLASVPVFLRKKQAQQEIPPGADFGVVFHQRPRPSYLVLLKSFAPDCEPNVIAVVAHRSGRLLLQATAGEPCFLFDAETRAATRLPPSPTTSASTSSRGAAWDSSPIDAWQATTWPPSSSPRRPRATAPSFATPPSPSSGPSSRSSAPRVTIHGARSASSPTTASSGRSTPPTACSPATPSTTSRAAAPPLRAAPVRPRRGRPPGPRASLRVCKRRQAPLRRDQQHRAQPSGSLLDTIT
ncbi:hypothetical protein SEVIR_3G205602v4 [Setaria viridis]